MITAALTAAVSAHARHVAADTLEVAMVTAERGMIVSRTDSVSLDGLTDAGSALTKIPGLTITDMGGQAGLKTVSLRGMGTSHTAIFIDGIRIGNLQSGQSDLGMLALEDFRTAVIDYAQNSINFITAGPQTGSGRKVTADIAFKGGSFCTCLPYASLGWRINDKLSMRVKAGGTFSKGDFPYKGTDTEGNTAEMRRSGNDISKWHAGADFFGGLTDGRWQAKAYFNSTDRGTPGSTDWPSSDRQKDRNMFIQGSLDRRFGSYGLKISAKGSYDDLEYFSSWGDSRYEQGEFQLNTSHSYRIKDWWDATLALGGQADRLKSGNYAAGNDGSPAAEGIMRLLLRSSIGTGITLERLKASLTMEYEGLRDISSGTRTLSLGALSPSASIRFRIADGLDIAAFGRRAYRAPMFNELYYIGYGNGNLKPEDAWMTDIGMQWSHAIGRKWDITIKADGFFNWLDNKITSAPSTSDPNIWLPYNIGKVFSAGTDISARASFSSNGWDGSISAEYTLVDAKDKTPDSASSGKQIPYIARHSLTAAGSIGWKGWKLDAVWNMREGRSGSYGDLPGWNTLDISLSRSFRVGREEAGRAMSISLRADNLTDERYELSAGYPMPGRSLMAGISFRL